MIRNHNLLTVAGLFLLTGLADAEEVTRLTTDSKLKHDPTFTRQGSELVYVVLENPTQLRIVTRDMKTGETTPLHKDVTKSEFEPSISSDGRFEAFVQSRGNLSLALVVRDAVENKQWEVKPGGGFSGLRSPSLSPSSDRVLYAYPEKGRQHIYSVNREAQDRKQLTDSSGVNNWPSYSADGKQIVFSSTRDGNYEIYVMNADGSSPRRLTHSDTQDIRPKFSPDGKQISFTSNRDGNYEIYLLTIATGEQRRITNHPERDDYAAWHPDGKHLVIISEREGQHDLYLVKLTPEKHR